MWSPFFFLFASRHAEALPEHLALIMRCFTFVQHDVWKFLIGTLMGPDCYYKITSLSFGDLDTLPWAGCSNKIFSLCSKILIRSAGWQDFFASLKDLDSLPWAGCSNKKRFFALTGSEPFFNSTSGLQMQAFDTLIVIKEVCHQADLFLFGRGYKIRTCDLYVPNVARYQLR